MLIKALNKFKTTIEFLVLLSVDILTLIIVFNIAVFLRVRVLPRLYGGFTPDLPFEGILDNAWIFLVFMFFFFYEGLYSKKYSFWDEIKAYWKVILLSTVGVFTIVSFGKLSGQVSRTIIMLMGTSGLLVLPLFRMGAKKFLRRIGLLRRRVLILGAGHTGELIARAIKREPNYGYEIIGYLDDDPNKIGTIVEGAKVHKGTDAVMRYVGRCNITDVIIAMPGTASERSQGLINKLQHKAIRVLYVPGMLGIPVLSMNILHFFQEQAFALELKNNLDHVINRLMKKMFDYIIALVLTLLVAIPGLVILFIIKVTSKGSAIYVQERIGRSGKLFKCYKFRTMYMDAEERLKVLLENDPARQHEWQKYWKLNNDPRVTHVGRWLRRTSLDELPQIVNVLKGQMSLVGPRPYLPREREFLKDYGTTILTVLPGISGLWQVSGRSETSYEYRLAMDSWYVRNWTLWLDIVILLKTISVVMRKRGAM